MKTAIKLASALVAGLSLNAGATDIRLSNLSNVQVHPYFRSNCFAAPTPRNQWVFFGGVNAFDQFTWTQFELLMDPACRRPTVDFTYTVGGMMPPLPDLPDDLVASRIRVSTDTNIVGVYVSNSVVLRTGKGDRDD